MCIDLILNCPFCGSKCIMKNTTFGDDLTEYYRIECIDNNHTLDCWLPTEQEAKNIWNERI
jgi:hypothetical protein